MQSAFGLFMHCKGDCVSGKISDVLKYWHWCLKIGILVRLTVFQTSYYIIGMQRDHKFSSGQNRNFSKLGTKIRLVFRPKPEFLESRNFPWITH